jgi:hypothetical protein
MAMFVTNLVTPEAAPKNKLPVLQTGLWLTGCSTRHTNHLLPLPRIELHQNTSNKNESEINNIKYFWYWLFNTAHISPIAISQNRIASKYIKQK